MKLIAIILSTYILGLITIPCADDHVAINSNSFELQEQTSSHDSDVDCCSPFCFCNCCQSSSLTTTFNTFQFNLVGFKLIASFILQNEIESNISFWRPPKI